ncbi:Tyrosyl-DNA phosphodiesterase [Ceratocystis platani]|uniref:Tyrosyl-DNA phosphodiesterase n=1 Tax=Ceratocystis fimbriata f. sp. platani TaxID=88771 RepID=A0A0F8D9X6_CERFI|nr:Tyrosyl-DNA phosphodiesterase [Ceratocystis platani]
MAVVSSFQWDEDFLRQNIDVFRTKLYLVVYADSDEQQSYEESKPSANIRYIYPPIYRRGIMHSKLMILKFALYLRIVVPTANFVSYDWGYTGPDLTVEQIAILLSLGLATSNTVELDVVSSSVGKLTMEFLAKIYASCRGYQISDRRIVQNGVAKETPGDLADHFRFYFPSLKTVLGSLQGRGGAGTICLNSKWFNEASFPRKVFRECISGTAQYA